MNNEVRNNKIAFWGSALFILLINILWFSKYEFSVLMGDDLNAWKNFSNSSGLFNYSFETAFSNKYRPVFSSIQFLLFESFGPKSIAFKFINLLINYLIAMVIFSILNSMTKEKGVIVTFFPLLITCLYITSRFSYYNILQINGLMEAMCLLFLILIIGCLLKYDKSKKERYLIWVIILNFLIVFTHERYIVIVPALVFLYCCLNFKVRKKLFYSFMLLIPAIINFLLKKFLFSSNFLEGTSGATIDFDLSRTATFFISGFLNLFGFNIGQSYLSGLSFHESNLYAKILSFVIFISFFLLILLGFRKYKNNRKHIIILITNIILIASLILAASITIRQEFRWLYAPYTILIVLLFYLLRDIKNTKIVPIILMVFITASLLSNIYYRGFQFNMFSVSAQIIAESANDEIIEKIGEDLKYRNLYIEKNDTALDWTLLDSLFFQVYTDNPDFKVTYFTDISEINLDQLDEKSSLVYKFNSSAKKFVNVSQEVLININERKNEDYVLQPENWKIPDSGYTLQTESGEKLYYTLVEKSTNQYNTILVRTDTNQPYVLSNISRNNETLALLEPNEFAIYKANDDYNFLWISVPDKVIWNTKVQYHTRE